MSAGELRSPPGAGSSIRLPLADGAFDGREVLERGLLDEARACFIAGRYQQSLELLESVHAASPDTKVAHNLAVTRFLRAGREDPSSLNQLLDELTNIQAQQRVAAAAAAGGAGASVVDPRQLSSPNGSLDSTVLDLNIASLLSSLGRHAESLAIAEPYFRSIHCLDSVAALRLCLMLGAAVVEENLPEKAASILAYMERVWKTAPGETGWLIRSGHPPGDPQMMDDLLSYLPVMKSRIYLFLGNAKAANREAKSALVLAADGAAQPAVVERTCLQAHFAKAHLELARGNGGKALAVLTSATSDGEPAQSSVRALQLNNAGIIFNRQERPHPAALCFSRAVSAVVEASTSGSDSGSRDRRPQPLPQDSGRVLYHAGLQSLQCGSWALAFASLEAASCLLPPSPTLNLRLAECCIGYHTESLNAAVGASGSGGRNPPSLQSLGAGPSGSPGPRGATALASPADGEAAELTLEKAGACLAVASRLVAQALADENARSRRLSTGPTAYPEGFSAASSLGGRPPQGPSGADGAWAVGNQGRSDPWEEGSSPSGGPNANGGGDSSHGNAGGSSNHSRAGLAADGDGWPSARGADVDTASAVAAAAAEKGRARARSLAALQNAIALKEAYLGLLRRDYWATIAASQAILDSAWATTEQCIAADVYAAEALSAVQRRVDAAGRLEHALCVCTGASAAQTSSERASSAASADSSRQTVWGGGEQTRALLARCMSGLVGTPPIPAERESRISAVVALPAQTHPPQPSVHMGTAYLQHTGLPGPHARR